MSLLAVLSCLRAQTYDEWRERADRAMEQDSLALAEECFREALRSDPAHPNNALLFSNLGSIQRRQGKYELAMESYTFALNLAPRAVPILLNRATLYLEQGREEAARVDYSQVLDLDEDNAEALLMRAYILMQQRDYKAARSDYEHLLRVDADSYNGRLGLATLEQKVGRFEAALRLLGAMLENPVEDGKEWEKSEVALLYVARAGVELQMKLPDLALLDLEEALRLDASQADAYLMRGQIYLEQGKKPGARRDFEKAAELGIPQSELRTWMQQCK